MKKLSPTQIGYLRRAASSAHEPRNATGPLKAMLRKLRKLGLVEELEGLFQRTDAGDSAVASFDAGLTHHELQSLRALLPNAPTAPTLSFLHGLRKLNDAGLVYYKGNLRAVTTEAGQAVLKTRGGYGRSD